MKKVNLDNIQEAGSFKRPEAGPYICTIQGVLDFPEKQYLKVTYDISQGEFKGYYDELRAAYPDWDWCGAYCKSYKETALPMFKRFCSAVSKSNGNYVFDAGEQNADEQSLVGKSIGLLFQEEEYYGNDGNIKTRLIVAREFPVDQILKQKTPEPKLLEKVENVDEFKAVDVKTGIDEELPFA